MKRFFFCVAVILAASSLPALELRLGLSGWEGLTYRGEPAFGWTGSAAQVLLEGPSQWLPAGLRPLGGGRVGRRWAGDPSSVPDRNHLENLFRKRLEPQLSCACTFGRNPQQIGHSVYTASPFGWRRRSPPRMGLGTRNRRGPHRWAPVHYGTLVCRGHLCCSRGAGAARPRVCPLRVGTRVVPITGSPTPAWRQGFGR